MTELPAGVSRAAGEPLVRMAVFALLLILIVSLGIVSASIRHAKSLLRREPTEWAAARRTQFDRRVRGL